MPELPSGTVTFLFTDVEGSTRLLQRLSERYEDVLVEHRRLLRGAFTATGGVEVDAQGDAFFVAFRRAKEAVAAAAEVQRALHEHEWPDGVEVRVRIGVHTGEPTVGAEGFVGLPVHRAARICAAGHGGQVLLSAATRELVEETLPAGLTLRDLGEHRLKDLERPERISELVVAGLEREFPSLKTVESQPVRATPFAGQERELAHAAHAAVARSGRAGLAQRWRSALTVAVARNSYTLPLLQHALRDSVRRPFHLAVVAGGAAIAAVAEPWLAVAVVVLYGGLVAVTARRLRFSHSIESVGLRLHSIARVAEDDRVGARVRELAGTIVRASRSTADADRLLAQVDRKEVARDLAYHREQATASPRALRAADETGRLLDALDQLARQRRAFDHDTEGLAEAIEVLRERIFRSRLVPSLADELPSETDALIERVSAAAAALDQALAEAKLSIVSATPVHAH